LGSKLILKHENRSGLEKCFGIQFTFSQVWENTKMNPKHSHFGSWNALGVFNIENKSANGKYYLNQTFIVSLNFF
jgi:hypothetical protein